MQLRAITSQPNEKLRALLDSTGRNTTYEHVIGVPLRCWRPNFSWYVPHFLLIYFPDPQNPSKTAQNSRKTRENPVNGFEKSIQGSMKTPVFENPGANLEVNGYFKSGLCIKISGILQSRCLICQK